MNGWVHPDYSREARPGGGVTYRRTSRDYDIVDDIDALIDEQLEAGEPRTGYPYGDPHYPRCGHCGRHWHGLPVTARIAAMYAQGRYDDTYTTATDDSPVICPGSDFIGPLPPPPPPARRRAEEDPVALAHRIIEGLVDEFNGLFGSVIGAAMDAVLQPLTPPGVTHHPDDNRRLGLGFGMHIVDEPYQINPGNGPQ